VVPQCQEVDEFVSLIEVRNGNLHVCDPRRNYKGCSTVWPESGFVNQSKPWLGFENISNFGAVFWDVDLPCKAIFKP
jgi:hypothetical protein